MTSSPVTTQATVARTVRVDALDTPVDLLAHLGPGGFAWLPARGPAFVTSGVAAVLAPGEARATLAGFAHEGLRPAAAAGPIAVGALPFRGDGRLVVPARVVGFDPDGGGWITDIGGDDPGAPSGTTASASSPARVAIESLTDPSEWRAAVRELLAHIDGGGLTKAVLARAVRCTADAPFDVAEVAARLHHQQPGCTVYVDGGFVGASPELLVRRRGELVESRPLAGTVPRDPARTDDAAAIAALAASAKDRHEHRIVVDAVVATLRAACTTLDVSGPAPEPFATVTHLATDIRGRLADPGTDALTLARALHPTPAVGGAPTGLALDLLTRLEPVPRGCYAGPVGWLGASGDGDWHVALRGAALDGCEALLHAGAGIVAGSDPDAEWDETALKLDPMLRALVHP